MVQCPHSMRLPWRESRSSQDLINVGKLKFEDLDRPTKVKNRSRKDVEMTRQEKETPKEVNFGKAAISKEKVTIAKVRKSEAGSPSTTEGLKERSCKPNGEEEKKMLQDRKSVV